MCEKNKLIEEYLNAAERQITLSRKRTDKADSLLLSAVQEICKVLQTLCNQTKWFNLTEMGSLSEQGWEMLIENMKHLVEEMEKVDENIKKKYTEILDEILKEVIEIQKKDAKNNIESLRKKVEGLLKFTYELVSILKER